MLIVHVEGAPGACRATGTAPLIPLAGALREQELAAMKLRLWVCAPAAPERAAVEEDVRTTSGAIVHGEALDIKNHGSRRHAHGTLLVCVSHLRGPPANAHRWPLAFELLAYRFELACAHEVLAGEGAAACVGPLGLLEASAGANAVVIGVMEVAAELAEVAFLEAWAGEGALPVQRDNRLVKGAHALLAVKRKEVRAIAMLHFCFTGHSVLWLPYGALAGASGRTRCGR